MRVKPKLQPAPVVIKVGKALSLKFGTTLEGQVSELGANVKFTGHIVKRGPTDVPKGLSSYMQTLEFDVGDLDSALRVSDLQVRVVDPTKAARPDRLRLTVSAVERIDDSGNVELHLQRGPPDVPKGNGPKKPKKR